MRPHFEAFVPVAQRELIQRVTRRLGAVEPRVHAIRADRHLELLVDESDRHFWSPWLSVDIESVEGGSQIRARFGPHPSLWTGIMSLHILLAFIALSGWVYGTALWTLGRTPWPLWAMPIAGLVMLGTYAGTLAGQRLGSDQMHVLHAALDELLGHSTWESATATGR